jgi:hypothetical protein
MALQPPTITKLWPWKEASGGLHVWVFPFETEEEKGALLDLLRLHNSQGPAKPLEELRGNLGVVTAVATSEQEIGGPPWTPPIAPVAPRPL